MQEESYEKDIENKIESVITGISVLKSKGMQGKDYNILYDAMNEDELVFLFNDVIVSYYDYLNYEAGVRNKPPADYKKARDFDEIFRVLEYIYNEMVRIMEV